MSFAAVISGLRSGTYTVTRIAAPTRTMGRAAAGSTSTLSGVVASVQPVTGRDLKTLPEGRHADDCRMIYTETALLVTDRVALDGDAFEVYRVRKWEAFGETFYIAHASRLVVP